MAGYEDTDNGVFHLSENELLEGFDYYSVCQINMATNYAYEEFTCRKNEDLYFRVKIPAKSNVNMRVVQKFKRFIKDSSYEYSPFVFEIGKINSEKNVTFISEGDTKTYFGDKSVNYFDKISLKSLDSGDYFVRISM